MNRLFPIPLLLFLILAAAAGPAAAGGLTDLEREGRDIYRKGTSPNGSILATLGSSGNRVSARFMPCANCHGLDGLGRPEGTLEPPALLWDELTKPYGHRHGNGRAHGPFDETSLQKAVREGVDPAGNALHSGMPRYFMTDRDAEALTAYLKVIAQDDDPGISSDALRLGVLLPGKPSATNPLHALIQGFFSEINAGGGIFGRQVEVVLAPPFHDVTSYLQAVRHLVQEEDVFMLFGVSMAEADGDLFPILKPGNIPLLTPLVWTERTAIREEALRFQIFPGPVAQARALTAFAAGELKLSPPSAIVIPPDGQIFGRIWDVFNEEVRQRGWPEFKSVNFSGKDADAAQIAADLHQAGVEALFYFGPAGGLGALLREADRLGWNPRVFASMRAAGRQAFSLPRSFSNRVYLSTPTLPSNLEPDSLKEFQRLMAKYQVPRFFQVQALNYFAAARVLTEALRLSGQRLSRQNLMQSLEGMSQFDTGVTPPVSFGPNRRTGSMGAYLLPVDLEQGRFGPRPVWVRLDAPVRPAETK